MTGEDIILSQSEYESLLEEIHRLQARISELTALRDDLIYHICPALQAEYEEKIASLERELLAAEMYLRENQRILEILQAQMNQQKEPSFEEAEKEAREEFKEYEEDLKKKAKEAEEFKKHWENESAWSEHDRKDKEEKQKRKEEQKQKKQQDQQKTAEDRADFSKKKNARLDGEEEDEETSDDQGDDTDHDDPSSDQEDGESGSKKKKKKHNDSDRIGKDDDQDDDSEDNHDGGGEEGNAYEEEEGSDSPIKRLKRLYRRIVKRLHPDVHPDSTPREKELFNMAQEAMKSGDLEGMERIYDELSGMDAPEEKFEDTPEGIASLKGLVLKLRERLRILQREIDHIRSEFPYTMKSFLEDEQAVEEKRHELSEKLRNLREANEKLVDFIQKMKQQMGL